MTKRWAAAFLGFAFAACGGGAPAPTPTPPEAEAPEPAEPTWEDSFALDPADLETTGRNDFWILEPGYRLVLEGKGDEDVPFRVEIVVTDKTETVDGVATRVVEEREWVGNRLIEVSRNFFAISRTTRDVYSFGEEVDIYRDGQVVSHGGSWRAGVDGARAGLMMPGAPAVGRRHHQEVAPGVAMDRAEIVDTAATIETPGGRFEGCVEVHETTPLEPDDLSVKVYAPGVGLVRDDSVLLVEHGTVEAPRGR